MSSVEENTCGDNAVRLVLALSTERGDYQVRKAGSGFGFRELEYLPSARLILQDYLDIVSEANQRCIVLSPWMLRLMLLF